MLVAVLDSRQSLFVTPPFYSPLCLTCRKLKGFIKQWKLKDIVKNQDKTRWEEDYTLLENEGLFDEYLEMGQYFW